MLNSTLSPYVKKLTFPIPKKSDEWIHKGVRQFNNESNIPYVTTNKNAYIDTDNSTLIKIFYCHGNGEDLNRVKEYIPKILKNMYKEEDNIGYVLKAVEYPAYGESIKSYDELNPTTLLEDAELSFNKFNKYVYSKKAKVYTILLGYSIGCSPCLYIASKAKYDNIISGLVLVAPFKSALQSTSGHFMFKAFIKDFYPNDTWIHRVNKPIICIQSKSDEAINYDYNSDVFIKYSMKHVCLDKFKHNEFIGTNIGLKYISDLIYDLIKHLKEEEKHEKRISN